MRRLHAFFGNLEVSRNKTDIKVVTSTTIVLRHRHGGSIPRLCNVFCDSTAIQMLFGSLLRSVIRPRKTCYGIVGDLWATAAPKAEMTGHGQRYDQPWTKI